MKHPGLIKRNQCPSGIFSPGQEKLAEKWIRRCFYFGVGAFLLVGILECAFYFVVRKMNFLLGSPLLYLIKYILAPCGANLLVVAATALSIRKMKKPWSRACAVSLMYVGIAFVVYTVHVQFDSLGMIYGLVIFMTVIYGEWKLTTITATASMVSKIISDLFLSWSPGQQEWRIRDTATFLDFWVSLFVLAVIFAASLMIIRFERERYEISSRLEQDRIRLYEETLTDELTGIRNRNALRISFDKMQKSDGKAIFVMLDVDHFKTINDTWGHTVGDQYLQKLASLLDVVPGADAFRFGGDEFCLLFQNAERIQVERECRIVQENFHKSRLCRLHGQTSISFGAAEYEKGLPPSELVKRADTALYRAKEKRGILRFYIEEGQE